MHFAEVKGILSAQNGMNLYRGCQHGCIYCDSRSKCYHMEHDFEDIEVKSNALELLEQALRRKRRPCMVGMGSMTDPYIPLETNLRHTRGALELLERYGFGATLITKSDRVLRDVDIFRRLNRHGKGVVQMTLTTFDEKLCRLVEPGVCTTAARFAALKELQAAGVPTVVWLCPILPFLNDTEENIRGLVEYCRCAGVRGIINFGMGVTLRQGNREYFYAQLDKKFPGLKEEYIRRYSEAYSLPSPREAELTRLFYRLCTEAGICCDNREIFEYLNTLPENKTQLSLFDTEK